MKNNNKIFNSDREMACWYGGWNEGREEMEKASKSSFIFGLVIGVLVTALFGGFLVQLVIA